MSVETTHLETFPTEASASVVHSFWGSLRATKSGKKKGPKASLGGRRGKTHTPCGAPTQRRAPKVETTRKRSDGGVRIFCCPSLWVQAAGPPGSAVMVLEEVSPRTGLSGVLRPDSRQFLSWHQISNELRGGQLTVKQLKAAGFSAAELREHGYRVAQLRVAGGYDIDELLEGGFRANECKHSGISARRLIKAGYSVRDLKDANFSATQLHHAGCTAGNMKSAGFTAAELAVGGFDANQLRKVHFSLAVLKKAGFNPKELLDAGYTLAELRATGFDWHSLMIWCKVDADELRSLGFFVDAHELRRFFEEHPDDCRDVPIADLVAAGVSQDEIKRKLGHTTADITQSIWRAAEIAPPSANAAEKPAQGSLKHRGSAGFSGLLSGPPTPAIEPHAPSSPRRMGVLEGVLNGTT